MERSEVNAEGIPSGESMTMTDLESAKFPCHGCFATLSMTFINAFYIETIFVMASSFQNQI